MQDSSSTSNNSALQIDPKVFLGYILRYWYLLLIGLLGALLYGYYQVRYTPATYSTNARMLVKDEYSSWGQEYFLPGMELVSSRNRLVNEIGIIKSFPLMNRVAKELDWDISYAKIGNIKTTEMYPASDFRIEVLSEQPTFGTYYLRFKNAEEFQMASNQDSLDNMPLQHVDNEVDYNGLQLKVNQVSANLSTENNYSFTFVDAASWGRYFQGSLNIDVEKQESSILILSQSGQTPKKSIDFLNTLMESYIAWGIEQNNQIASNTIAFVDEQLRSIADSLVITEHQLENFYKQNFSERIFIQEEAAGNNMQKVFELEDELTQRSIQREYYAALVRTLQSDNFTAFPSAAVFGFDDNNADQMISRIHEMVREINEKALSMKESSEPVARLQKQLQQRKADLVEVARNNQKQVTQLIDSLKQLIRREENKVLQIPAEQRKFFTLKRENKLLSDLYTFLLNKRSEASIAKASNNPKAQVLDYADVYRTTYLGPHSSNIYLLALFIGLALPLFLILLIYLFNNKIINTSDLEKATSIPVLGSVAYKKGIENNLVVTGNLKSITAEAYRSLRTNLNFMTEGKEKVKILVTSSISGEGKTFTSINLAAIYAASGKRTVILGADMRKPKLFGDFGLTNEKGLSNYLIGKSSLEEVIQHTKVEFLDLLSAGPVPPNPAELLETNRMKTLMEELEKRYDAIIIDSPPLGLVTDALLLKKYADAGLYIVRHNYTKKAQLKNVNQLYEDKILSKMGIVINAIQHKKGMGAYGYGYGYGNSNSYGGGYYAED